AREGVRRRRRAADRRGAPRGGALLQPVARDPAGPGADEEVPRAGRADPRGGARSERAGREAPRLVAPLPDQVARALMPGERGVHGVLGEHEAIARAEVELLPLGTEGDLAFDHPEALVVVVRVLRVVGVGRIDPDERLEALGRQTGGERTLRRRLRAAPRNSFE